MIYLTITAIKYARAAMRVEAAKQALDEAYFRWKCRHKTGFIERNSLEWHQMMAATSPEYMELKRAKSQARYWTKKLVRQVQEVQ